MALILVSLTDKRRGKNYIGKIYYHTDEGRKELLATVQSDDYGYMHADKHAIAAYMSWLHLDNPTGYKDLTKHAEAAIMVLRILGSDAFKLLISKSSLAMLVKRGIIKWVLPTEEKYGKWVEIQRRMGHDRH